MEKFERVLSKGDLIALAFGAMIGWSWVVLGGKWIEDAGVFGASGAFLVGGFVILLIGLVYAELSSAMPKAGGEHVYSHRALGNFGSFVCTWSIILGYVAVVTFEAVALPAVLEYMFPEIKWIHLWEFAGEEVYLSTALLGVLGAVAMTALNYFGVKTAAFYQKAVTISIMFVGLLLFGLALFTQKNLSFEPRYVNGVAGMFSVLAIVPYMLVGFDVIPQIAEEAKMPFRDIGKFIIYSVLVAIVWYIIIILSIGFTFNLDQIKASELVAPDVLKNLMNSEFGATLVVLAGVGGILTSWNSFYMGGSRAIYAMAESKLLPSPLASLHPKYKSPKNAIFLIGGITMIAPFFGKKVLEWCANAGGFGIVIAYLFVAISFIVLRFKEPKLERPYKQKYGLLIGFSAVLLSLALMFLYLPGGKAALVWPYEWVIFLGWTLLGLLFYAVTRRD